MILGSPSRTKALNKLRTPELVRAIFKTVFAILTETLIQWMDIVNRDCLSPNNTTNSVIIPSGSLTFSTCKRLIK